MENQLVVNVFLSDNRISEKWSKNIKIKVLNYNKLSIEYE